MEFESVVAAQLQALGYPIFYRNFHVYLNYTNISEFDIISDGFIVEVKSGRHYKTRGLNFMHSHGMLPVGFRYYIYCPALDNEEIACLNASYAQKDLLYINSFTPIISNHKPSHSAALVSESVLANFLNLPMKTINLFDALYIKQADLDKMKWRVHAERDRFSFTDNVKWSDKIRLLEAQGRLIGCAELPASVPSMIKHSKPPTYARVRSLEPFVIKKEYYVNAMPKDRSMIDIYLGGRHAPRPKFDTPIYVVAS